MKMLPHLALACVVTMSGIALAAEPASGLPVGDFVPAFNVRDITGPHKGETLCYRCKFGDRPVVALFIRDLTESTKDLVQKLDSTIGKNKDAKMAGFVVFMTNDPDATEKALADFAKSAKLENIPLTVIEGETGPKNYKISKDAETTVLMWADSEVKVNRSFEKGKLDGKAVDAVVADTKQILQ